MGKPGHHRLVMAEVAGQVDNNNMTVGLGKLHGEIQAVVWRPVIHQNDFVIVADELAGRSTGPLMELGNVGRRLVEGCNDGQLHERTYLM